MIAPHLERAGLKVAPAVRTSRQPRTSAARCATQTALRSHRARAAAIDPTTPPGASTRSTSTAAAHDPRSLRRGARGVRRDAAPRVAGRRAQQGRRGAQPHRARAPSAREDGSTQELPQPRARAVPRGRRHAAAFDGHARHLAQVQRLRATSTQRSGAPPRPSRSDAATTTAARGRLLTTSAASSCRRQPRRRGRLLEKRSRFPDVRRSRGMMAKPQLARHPAQDRATSTRDRPLPCGAHRSPRDGGPARRELRAHNLARRRRRRKPEQAHAASRGQALALELGDLRAEARSSQLGIAALKLDDRRRRREDLKRRAVAR